MSDLPPPRNETPDVMPRRHIEWREEWFNGRVHALSQDTHFPGVDPEVFRNRAKVAARRRGYRIETSKAEGRPVIYLRRK